MPTETAKSGKKSGYKDKEKPTQIRFSNITAAKGGIFGRLIYVLILIMLIVCNKLLLIISFYLCIFCSSREVI